jgi:hypothetical protein
LRVRPLPVLTMRFTSEDASRTARLVAEQLLQGCPKIAPPSTSPPVSTPGFRGRFAPPAREMPRSPEPSTQGSPALRAFRPRGLAPPRRFAPPAAHGLVASHCRPWGSSGFRARHLPVTTTLPLRCHALQSFSTCEAVSPSPGTLCPPVVPGLRPLVGVPVDFRALLRAGVRSAHIPLPGSRARGSPGLPIPEASCLTALRVLRAARPHPKTASSLSRTFPPRPAVLGG